MMKLRTAIRDHSNLNVRTLTRSPMALEDFDIFQSFGDRLPLGTSLPTLNPKISDIHEPKVAAPRHRLKLLTDADAAGIHTYVAVAPVYPEVGCDGMLEVFEAVKAANPCTVFAEPVNLRLEIAERVRSESRRQARRRRHEEGNDLDVSEFDIDMTPYSDSEAWVEYAVRTLRDAERAAEKADLSERFHLWPDHQALGRNSVINRQPDPEAFRAWLRRWWDRVSEWPDKTGC
jgi:DNA repair photolyase